MILQVSHLLKLEVELKLRLEYSMELELEAEERPNAYLFLFFCRTGPAGVLAWLDGVPVLDVPLKWLKSLEHMLTSLKEDFLFSDSKGLRHSK